MIKKEDLTELDIGRWVVYYNGHYEETGRVKSFNGDLVFVVFRCDSKWHEFKNYTGQGCNPKSLRFFEDGE